MNDNAEAWRDSIVRSVENLAMPARVSEFGRGENLLTHTFEALGFTSLAILEFCISVQVETGVDLTMDQVAEFGTPEKVIAHVRENR